MSKDKNKLQDIFGEAKSPAESVTTAAIPKVKKPAKKQKRIKGQYDLPEGLTAEISAISKQWKAPASGIAALFLVRSLEAYKRGELDIKPYLTDTDSLRFLYGIDPGYSNKE